MRNSHFNDAIEILLQRAMSGRVKRRSLIKAVALLASLPLAMRSGVTWAQGKELVVVNWGGDAINAFKQAWTNSFAQATGIPVRIDGSGPTDGALRAQVASGRPKWDVVDTDDYTAWSLGRQGILQPLDYSVIDRNKVNDGLALQYGVSGYLFSYVMAWDSKRFGPNRPRTWADFWDVKKFPGKRTLYKWMSGMLEAALMADGVAPAHLYPLDVARALRKLDELKPQVLAYWASGAESQQLMINGDASVGVLWHTRSRLLEEDSQGRIQWSFDNGLLTSSNWAVLKDNPAGSKTAMAFIAHAQRPEGQLELFKLLGNGPANPAARNMIPAAQRKFDCGSPDNVAKQVFLQTQWYADNYSKTFDQYLKHISK